jgi:hypothetical protein
MQRQRKSYSTTPTWTTYKAWESRSVNLKRLKNKPGQSWKKVGFTLHKWHSNVEELETISNETAKGDPTRNLRVSQRQRSSEFFGRRKQTLSELTSKLVNSLFHHRQNARYWQRHTVYTICLGGLHRW